MGRDGKVSKRNGVVVREIKRKIGNCCVIDVNRREYIFLKGID